MNRSKDNHMIIIRLILYIFHLAILVNIILDHFSLEGDDDDFAPCIASPEIVLSRVVALNHCKIILGSIQYCQCK